MDDRNKLLKRIQVANFVLDELNLFLDTHPTNKEALEHLRKYKAIKDRAHNEYVSMYGPLNPYECTSTEEYSWVKNPWPWEREVM